MDHDHKILLITVYISLVVQFVAGVVQLHGLFLEYDEEKTVLRDILWIETLVQFVELMFYVYIVKALHYLKLNEVTKRRYVDWMITTPAMLLSTMLYFKYKKTQENFDEETMQTKTRENVRLGTFLKENGGTVARIVIWNGLMLLFGYLGESRMMNATMANVIGFVFFGIAFYEIYKEFVTESTKIIYGILCFIWAMYGAVYFLPDLQKNIGYNLLDIFSKNFYGLFIYYKILKT